VLIPEGRGTLPGLTVEENLLLGARLGGAPLDWASVNRYLPRLHEHSWQNCASLSGGAMQMLAIARAIAARARVLLLDEPSRGLAPRGAGLHRRRDRHHRHPAADHRVDQLRRPHALLHPDVAAGRARAAATYAIRASRTGRAFRVLATRPDVASSLGIQVRRYRVIAFVVSAVLASVAGSLIVEFSTYASPDNFNGDVGILVFAMLFIGGIRTASGPICAAIVTVVPVEATAIGKYTALTFELILLLILVVWPRGLGISVATGVEDLIGRFVKGLGQPRPARRRGVFRRSGAMGDALVVSGISKQFSGVEAVSDVTFTVKPGEVHGLVGPNGAGKSTALGILPGFIPPDAGSITYRELIGVPRTTWCAPGSRGRSRSRARCPG
jgi:ABC-type transport system involved in cytochrome c biogenesis ATPase subunit